MALGGSHLLELLQLLHSSLLCSQFHQHRLDEHATSVQQKAAIDHLRRSEHGHGNFVACIPSTEHCC